MTDVDTSTAPSDTVKEFPSANGNERMAPEVEAAVKPVRNRRRSLVAGVSLLGLLLGASGIALGLGYINSTSAPQPRSQVVAARSLAVAKPEAPVTAHAEAKPSEGRPPQSVVRRVADTRPASLLDQSGGDDDMGSFLRMQHGPDATPASLTGEPVARPPASATAAGAGQIDPVPVSFLAAPADTTSPASAAPVEPASKIQPPSASQLVPAVQAEAPATTPIANPNSKVADPAGVAASFRPNRMTDATQIDVLELVSKLGTMVQEERAQLTQMRSDQASMVATVSTRIDDFKRRIALAEARASLASPAAPDTKLLLDATAPVQSRPFVASAPAPGPATPHPSRVAATSDTQQVDHSVHRYHVQAASSSMAMLSEADAPGGSGSEIEVAKGTVVPGHGKVLSISQRGTVWLVTTERDVIQ